MLHGDFSTPLPHEDRISGFVTICFVHVVGTAVVSNFHNKIALVTYFGITYNNYRETYMTLPNIYYYSFISPHLEKKKIQISYTSAEPRPRNFVRTSDISDIGRSDGQWNRFVLEW